MSSASHKSKAPFPVCEVVDELDTVTIILLAALLSSLRDKQQKFTISDIQESIFAPTRYLCHQAINNLIDSGVVVVGETNQRGEVKYELCIQNSKYSLKELLTTLQDINAINIDKIYFLALETLTAECVEFIANELERLNIQLKTDSPPHCHLDALLYGQTPSQVHMLLWQTIRNLSQNDIRIFDAKDNDLEIFDYIIEETSDLHKRYKYFNRVIGSYQRRPLFKVSSISKIIFSYYLDEKNSYFSRLIL